MNKEEHSVYAIKFYAMQKQIDDLQKKAELGEHYKHLYSEVKKQKEDVVEYINHKFNVGLNYSEWSEGYNECVNRHKPVLLRMLGEIDE